MRRAFHALKNGRPGPVLLEMHEDHMQNEVTNLEIESPLDGNIKEIYFSVNDNVNVGQTLVIVE